MVKGKYCVIVWDSLLGIHPRKYFTFYGDLRAYLDMVDGFNEKYSGDIKFLYTVYIRDFKNRKWDYMGGSEDGKII